MKTNIGVNGACGRMGKRIIQLAHEDKSLQITTAIDARAIPSRVRTSARPPASAALAFP